MFSPLEAAAALEGPSRDRKSTRLNSSHSQISYAVFCLKKKKTTVHTQIYPNLQQYTPNPAQSVHVVVIASYPCGLRCAGVKRVMVAQLIRRYKNEAGPT